MSDQLKKKKKKKKKKIQLEKRNLGNERSAGSSKEEEEMGSSYSGEPNLGNERSAGSSRKGKKSSGSDKANKQPQRGLGVAQLEKIRLQTQMGCTYLPSLHGFQVSLSLSRGLYILRS